MERCVIPSELSGRITPPCSKSYAQRALAISLLAKGESRLHNIEFCDDTLSAIRCIEMLGAKVERIGESSLRIMGSFEPLSNLLEVGESGLATRLFTPIASLHNSPITIQGEGTLLRRPMNMMFEPLHSLGVELRDGGGYLPIEVKGPINGDSVEIDGSISSQFITGLLIALGSRKGEATIKVKNPTSLPYLDITLDAASKFSREIVRNSDYTEFYIPEGDGYKATEYFIESDWSAAAAWMVAGALAGELTIDHISALSKQADTAVCRALERCGASIIYEENRITVAHRELTSFNFDATQCPDLFPVLVALAASADGVTLLKGTSRLEYKESNRAEVLKEEYAKLGIEIDLEEEDTMKIYGGKIHGARCSAHGDHRIAMSLALAALRSDTPITIEDAECVAKSYPTFFEDLEMLQKR